jgi:hypothetical protein
MEGQGGGGEAQEVAYRVAIFFLVRDIKTGKNVQNEYKMYQMVKKYSKCP